MKTDNYAAHKWHALKSEIRRPTDNYEMLRSRWGDAIRGRMHAEHALDDSDAEIARTLEGCVCGDRLIAVAKYMRDVGDRLVEPAAGGSCVALGRIQGNGEDEVAPHHETAQSMAHTGSAGGVSAHPAAPKTYAKSDANSRFPHTRGQTADLFADTRA